MNTKEMKKREAEYRKFLEKLIRGKTEQFKKSAELGANVRPLRRGALKHDLEYFWTDEMWCQDITVLAWEEFSGEELTEDEYFRTPGPERLDNEDATVWLNTVWDEVFTKLAPELGLDPKWLEG